MSLTRHMMANACEYSQERFENFEEYDIFFAEREDADNYFGNCITGAGFFNVRFPKTNVRELTPEEIAKYQDLPLAINSTPIGNLKLIL